MGKKKATVSINEIKAEMAASDAEPDPQLDAAFELDVVDIEDAESFGGAFGTPAGLQHGESFTLGPELRATIKGQIVTAEAPTKRKRSPRVETLLSQAAKAETQIRRLRSALPKRIEYYELMIGLATDESKKLEAQLVEKLDEPVKAVLRAGGIIE